MPASGLARWQLVWIGITMVVTFSVTFATGMWRERRESPAQAAAAGVISAPEPPQAKSRISPPAAMPRVPSTTVVTPMVTPIVTPVVASVVAPPAVPPDVPVATAMGPEAAADRESSAERERDESFCAQGGAVVNHPLCRRLREQN